MKRKQLVAHVVATCKTSQRRACRAIGFHRATIRYQYRRKPDEETLRMAIVGLATLYGACGYRMLTVIDEYTRECLAIVVEKILTWEDVVVCLEQLFILRCLPIFIRSDNGSEFTTPNVRNWLKRLGVTTMLIEPGSPWENGYNESFNGTICRELLDREVFDMLLEAQVMVEKWRGEYNHIRPHSSMGYRPPAPEAVVPLEELVLKMDLTGERSKVEYCRLN